MFFYDFAKAVCSRYLWKMGIFEHQYLWKESVNTVDFFAMEIIIKGR